MYDCRCLGTSSPVIENYNNKKSRWFGMPMNWILNERRNEKKKKKRMGNGG